MPAFFVSAMTIDEIRTAFERELAAAETKQTL